MGIFQNLFKSVKNDQNKTYTQFQEIGTYKSYFGNFGNNIYMSDDVRSCIRALAEHTSKANPRCEDKNIYNLLSLRPNKFMNGKDFLAKTRNLLEIYNTAFIFIDRDNKGKTVALYPIPYQTFEAVQYKGDLYIQFQFAGTGVQQLTVPWADLAVLRKDYLMSDIAGESNAPLLPTLEVMKTLDQGLQNAVKSTSNLRGILKSTKGMLSPEDRKKQKDEFVRDYMNLNNSGGIASLDGTQDFREINIKPTTASAAEAEAYRERVYRYFNINENIVKSKYTEAEYDAFYESRIEPFLVALSLELTYKIFTERERAFGNEVWYESNRLQFASAKTKISMVALVDRGLMTPNEYRALFNMAPYEGGDEFVLRLDTSKTGDTTSGTEENEEDKEDGN